MRSHPRITVGQRVLGPAWLLQFAAAGFFFISLSAPRKKNHEEQKIANNTNNIKATD
jgi:hypothetical protein